MDLRRRAAAALALALLLLLLLLPLLSGFSDGGLTRVEGVDEGEQLLGLEVDLLPLRLLQLRRSIAEALGLGRAKRHQ